MKGRLHWRGFGGKPWRIFRDLMLDQHFKGLGIGLFQCKLQALYQWGLREDGVDGPVG